MPNKPLRLALAFLALAGCNDLLGLEDGKKRPEPKAEVLCGDGRREAAEACDDGNQTEGDGCDKGCGVEEGYACADEPSVCAAICGDGSILGSEACDDGNQATGDGCSACTIEEGFSCEGAPSLCAAICGDGSVVGLETCDDGNEASGDGCSACAIEEGFACDGAPSVCAAICGDGSVVGLETCDDGNETSGDGCSVCALEEGFSCGGAPSVCAAVCGDGLVVGPETCDDGNAVDDDCCSSSCLFEAGCEQEPNDSQALANDFDVLSKGGVMRARIDPSGDRDVFSFTVPPGQIGSLGAAIVDGFEGSTCASSALDPFLTVASVGATIATDDSGGVGLCSLVYVSVLGAGETFVEVVADDDDPLATFDYGLALTIDLCGDGAVTGSETCDDGNIASADGCNALCRTETFAESGANNDALSANGPFVPYAVITGSVVPGSDVDYFGIDVPAYADLRVATFDGAGAPSCGATTDTLVRLFAPDGVTQLALDDDGGVSPCSLIDPALSAAATHLAPRTYFVSVERGSGGSVVPAYTLVVDFAALCGDGVVTGSEECDGSPLCDPTCARIPLCGDTFIDAPETCDDGNASSGDGCSALCQPEEIEPNNTTLEADARALGATPIHFTSTARFAAAIGAVGDKDLFRVDLATSSVVRIETFDGSGIDCLGADATTLRLLDAQGASLMVSATSGIGPCAALTTYLPAGTYYASVEETGNNATIAAYSIEVAFLSDGGSESEPNDLEASADPLGGTSVFAFGDHQTNSDADYYAVTLPTGLSMLAEVVEGGAETCESSGVDSRLTLLMPGGLVLADDDDSGRGLCSRIDGTGSSPADGGAHALSAGTYLLRVQASPIAQNGTTGKFDYRLAVTLR